MLHSYANNDDNSRFFSQHDFALIPVRERSKAALELGWPDSASTDPAQWESWRARGYNLGIHAGTSRLIIVDLDTTKDGGREGAWKRYSEWCKGHGLPVYAPHCSTASQGMHVYFKIPDDIDVTSLRGKDLAEGINVLCNRRYAVAPGSSIALGTYGLFPNVPPPHSAPAALIEHCRQPVQEPPMPIAPGQYNANDVADLVRWLADNGSFEEYADWVSIGMALRVAGVGVDIWRLAHNETVTPDVEVAKWRSFDTEHKSGAVTLATWFKRAHDLGWKGSVSRSIAAMFGGAPVTASPSVVPSAALPDLLKTSGEFVQAFEPPDFLVDGILQRRYFYSVTAQTGVGKTAIAMRLAAHVATGRPLGDIAVEQGDVLYLAGENPSDVQARWLGLTRDMCIMPATAPVHFLAGAMDLGAVAERISSEVSRKGLQLALVIVDTAAAYNFNSEDENSNTQAGAYARQLRSLTSLPGGPAVLVLCHPTKRAGEDDLIPRGGGAFLAEVDGNIAVQKRDALLVASAQGKFRGSDAWTLRFELETMRDHPTLRDTRGRPIPTVIAKPVGEGKAAVMEKRSDQDDEILLRAVNDKPGMTPTDLAKAIGWTYGAKNEPNRTKVARVLARLQKEKLAVERLGAWRTTPAGDKELNRLDMSRPTVG